MSDHPKGLPSSGKSRSRLDRPWRVVLFNDDVHNFDDVVRQIRKATGFSLLRAMEITYLAHNEEQAVVYEGAFVDCKQVMDTLRKAGLYTQIYG